MVRAQALISPLPRSPAATEPCWLPPSAYIHNLIFAHLPCYRALLSLGSLPKPFNMTSVADSFQGGTQRQPLTMCFRAYLVIVPLFEPSQWEFSLLYGRCLLQSSSQNQIGVPGASPPLFAISCPPVFYPHLSPCISQTTGLTLLFLLAGSFWHYINVYYTHSPFGICSPHQQHLRLGGCVEERCIWAYPFGTGWHHLLGFQWGSHTSSTHREKWEEKQETIMIGIPTFWQPALKVINLTPWKLNPPFRKDIEF